MLISLKGFLIFRHIYQRLQLKNKDKSKGYILPFRGQAEEISWSITYFRKSNNFNTGMKNMSK